MRSTAYRASALVFCALLFSNAALAADTAKGRAAFSAEAYIEHVKYLASDELEGRKPGTPGIEKAATYIAYKFMSYGLEPAGVENTYFYPFEVKEGKTFERSGASLRFSGIDRKWEVGTDFIPLPFTKPEDFEGPLAFGGYGISYKPEVKDGEAPAGYDDYEDFDPKGKVLLIFRHEPKAEDTEAEFGGKNASSHAMFVKKANVAAERGVKAILVVNPPSREPAEDKLYEWSQRESRNTYRVPMLSVSRELAETLLTYAEMPDLKTLEASLTKERKSLSQDMKVMLATAKLGVKYLQARNVMGVVRGTDAPEEYIVVGAHFDHLGKGRRQFESGGADDAEIHNGADDNASGTSGVLELARVIAAGPRPRRSIIFTTFSAEEMGLLGSAAYVRNPTVPLSSIKAMVNFDMIGRLSQDALEIYGIPSATEFAELVSKYVDPAGIKYESPANGSAFFGASDHASFYYKGVPVLFPFTGVHKQYHKPDDDWDLIDSEGAAKLLTAFEPIIVELANMTSGPTIPAKSEKKENEASKPENPIVSAAIKNAKPADGEQSPEGVALAADAAKAGDDSAKARRSESSDAPAGRPRGGVRLGFKPAYNSDGEGVEVERVTEGSAAMEAGMKDGDRIVKIGKKDIVTFDEYREVMSSYKYGDEVDVMVLRGNEKLTIKVKTQVPPPVQEPR